MNDAGRLMAGGFEESGQSTGVQRKTDPFGGSVTETREVEDEIRSRKGANPKLISYQGAHDCIQTRYRNVKRLRNGKTMRLGENETLCNCSLNIGKWN